MMKDTIANRQLLNQLQGLFKNYPYKMCLRVHEGFITPYVITRLDSPKYTPYFRLEIKDGPVTEFRIYIQTTADEALDDRSDFTFRLGRIFAESLASDMCSQIKLAGDNYRVSVG